jgi:uroporphyrinogen-III synthase
MQARNCVIEAAPISSLESLSGSMSNERKPKVLITRPEAAARSLQQALEPLGYDTLIEPLLTIEQTGRISDVPSDVQALILTSAHAVGALGDEVRDLPIFGVGSATAEAARRAGFGNLIVGNADGAALAELIKERCHPKDGRLLHLSGEIVRDDLHRLLAEAGFDVQRNVVYRALASTGLSNATVDAWRQRQIDAVLLFSPRTAGILVRLLQDHALIDHVDRTTAICLSEQTATPCRAIDWKDVCVAAQPNQKALIRALEGSIRIC